MKYIITESQFKDRIYNKFADMLVDKTKIYGIISYEYKKYDYVGNIKYPHSDTIYALAFNDSESYEITSPSRYSLKDWFKMVGVDMDKNPLSAEHLWDIYLDKLEQKIIYYINDYLN